MHLRPAQAQGCGATRTVGTRQAGGAHHRARGVAGQTEAMPEQPQRVSIRYARLRRTLVIDIIPR